jgi:hypothetical protein
MKSALPEPLQGAVAALTAAHAPAQRRLYVYLHFAQSPALTRAVLANVESGLANALPELVDVQASRLQKVFDTAGASAGNTSVFHYVVEMDPEEGWMPELSDWYDREHMPGLAAVPGCIHAARYLNHDHGPLSLACYDLVTEDTKGSPPWMAMTHSEWSSRMRPHFTNTIRTMFQVLPNPPARSV